MAGANGRGSIRVIAGRYRGLRLATRPGREVRPTADRVKEALFSILGHDLTGAAVVDCFAGSGGLGIEALSRGARRVLFVERDPVTARLLEENLGRLRDAPETRVIVGDALVPPVWLGAAPPADLILADPPYGGGVAEAFLAALRPEEALRAGGRLALEHEAAIEPGGRGWVAATRRRYGSTGISIFTYGPPRPEEA
jgi:16S rRNA (guanine966-N2)-methyltransferase